LVFVHCQFQITETKTEKSVRKIEPTHRVDVAARGVNIGFVRRQRTEQVVKAGRQIAQPGAQIQNIWGRKYRDAPWLQNTIDFTDDFPVVFQVLNRLDACDKREPIIGVRKRFAIQIDSVDSGTRNREQFIRVIAAERTKGITRSNEPQQFPGPAAHIEVISARRHGRYSCDRAQDSLMNSRGT